MAPTVSGKPTDIRIAPTVAPLMDQTTSLMDTSRRLVYVTAFHPGRQALLGYVFRREEYPWTQMWDWYPGSGRRSQRGMEFAVQPFDLPRRDVIQANSMFDTPTYRWIGAKQRLKTEFTVFLMEIAEGFRGVKDVRLENGEIHVISR